jgi:hypothetical protein
MSKIGLGGTIFSMVSGVIFLIWGIVFLIWGIINQSRGTENELCIIVAIPVILFGVFLVFGSYRQLKGIKKGKEYEGPPEGFKVQ